MKQLAFCALVWFFSAATLAEEPKYSGKADPVKVAKLQDGSLVFGLPSEAHCTIKTRYGKLEVAWADVLAVEVAYRFSVEESASIEAWLRDLAAPGFAKRDAAQRGLIQFGRHAAPALRKALQQATPDYLDRGRAILSAWKLDPDSDEADPLRCDLVHTETMQIVGELTDEHFTLETKAFGMLKMPWKMLDRVESKTAQKPVEAAPAAVSPYGGRVVQPVFPGGAMPPAPLPPPGPLPPPLPPPARNR